MPAPVSNLINRPHPQPETHEQGYIYETSLAVPWAQPTSSLLSVLLGICLNLPFHHHGSLPAAPFVSFLGSSHPQALAFLSPRPLGHLFPCSVRSSLLLLTWEPKLCCILCVSVVGQGPSQTGFPSTNGSDSNLRGKWAVADACWCQKAPKQTWQRGSQTWRSSLHGRQFAS